MKEVLRITERDAKIEKRIDELFERVGRIRKIRRKKKIKKWINNCLNKQLKTKSDE